ncbi:hypothetical protein GGR28_003798 [Lewinella aquimaris]|uniref:Uncharacterized protein n=1 Tax=Neolewinella aquimaris TaxID=1835722 RepID=A0A840E7Y7_9BACT|nr:hypothetical protein [Neolewinella aquimaris]MBB4081150.1 hypothetical protein [Neolewinella aquimaris]
MKIYIVVLFMVFSLCMFGQSNRSELVESSIYLRATYFDQENEIIGLQLRTNLEDTTINERRYTKFKTEDFTDYPKIDNSSTYYESFTDRNYRLLDHRLEVIHDIDYNKTAEQLTSLFGEKVNTSLEFIDTRQNFPRDTLIVTDQTPRKYFQTSNPEVYAVIIPDLQTMAVSSNGQFYTKQLLGDNYNEITDGIINQYSASSKFDIQSDDEIQLLYRRKWYNDSTGLAEYEDKQFINIKFIGDSIAEDLSYLKLETDGYNFLSGAIDGPNQFSLQLADSGYYYGNKFIPFKMYSTELKVLAHNGRNSIFLQGVTKDTVGTLPYEKIMQATGDPYRYYILPFFPAPFVEFGNVEGIITYAKIKGVEKGSKRERTYITDRSNLRSIKSISKDSVELEIYFIEKFDVEVEIKDYETDEVIGSLTTQSHEGINIFKLLTEKLDKGKSYGVNINYKGENTAGSFSSGFKSSY